MVGRLHKFFKTGSYPDIKTGIISEILNDGLEQYFQLSKNEITES
jgi:hypothetical protein